MNKYFATYKQALALKELDFDEPCILKIQWLNNVHKDTKIPFEPQIIMNGKDIDFKYPLLSTEDEEVLNKLFEKYSII